MTSTTGTSSGFRFDVATLFPGIALAAAVAMASGFASPVLAHLAPVPPMVVALLFGLALTPFGTAPVAQPGVNFCVKKLLRVAIALLGLKIALGDFVALGFNVALMVLASMSATLIGSIWLARRMGKGDAYGALTGAATAICGASATLATVTVTPNYPNKSRDVAFVVVTTNAIATIGMLVYPAFAKWIGFDDREIGILLGATIHDVAQVVGAGFSVSAVAGDTAVMVKLFRVLMLLPFVIGIGAFFRRKGSAAMDVRVPPPVFAFVFIGLCLINSVAPIIPDLMVVYRPVRDLLLVASNWGLLVAIAALGLSTSLSAIAGLGWTHVAHVASISLFILTAVTGVMLALG